MNVQPASRERAALERLIRVAQRDTGQSRYAANFLLAWWNAGELGGFDLTDLWCVDRAIAHDMITVITFVASCHHYPDALGLAPVFATLIERWRPTPMRADSDRRPPFTITAACGCTCLQEAVCSECGRCGARFEEWQGCCRCTAPPRAESTDDGQRPPSITTRCLTRPQSTPARSMRGERE